MRRGIWSVLCCFGAGCSVGPSFSPTVVSTIGSERATQGFGNKIATRGGRTHVVWQEITRTGYPNRVGTYDHAERRFTSRTTLNVGVDNHARPVLAMDAAGYLHVVLSGHDTPVTYRRSLRPDDSTAWTAPVEIARGTYPVLVCGRHGRLYLTCATVRRTA